MPKAAASPKRPGTPIASGELVVTAQQSRFHADAVDAPESKEIDIKDLTISIGGKEVLDHASLRLREGVKYVFVGRNGTGKSTLLRALAERRVPGVPSNLRVLLLGQTRIDTDDVLAIEANKAPPISSVSVLKYVIQSNLRRERALREARLLSSALEGNATPLETVKAVRQLRCEKLEQQLAELRLIAARRSGARGAKARQAVNAKEDELTAAQSLLENSATEVTDQEITDEMTTGAEMLEEVRLSLVAMDADVAETKARNVLLGLGFPVEKIDQPYESLSGGWRTRCDLAVALTQKTDVLLLDEPTNFLDLPAVIWLQEFIRTSLTSTTVVVVTHDRDFADDVADELLLLRLVPARSLETFKGNLSTYETEKRKQIRRLTRMKEAQDKKIKHMEDTISSNVRAAKRTGDDKKLKQAASRRKKIEERTGLEVSATGGRFKLNRDLAGFHLGNRAEIEIPGMDPPVSITFPGSPAPLRFPGPIISMENVTFRYPKVKDDILKNIELIIHPGERVGLAGLNGSGKTTIFKLMMGGEEKGGLNPTKGNITRHSKARIEYYSQHAVEELEKLGAEDRERTALSHLLEVGKGELKEQEARAILGELGLRGRVVSDVPLNSLSGGQRVRLALAQVVWSAPHLLVLDEVTTHLDADTIVALIEALQLWEGALLVATHDRFFMRSVVEGQALDVPDGSDSDDEVSEATKAAAERAGVVYRLRNGLLKKLDGGMDKYESLVQKSVMKLAIR